MWVLTSHNIQNSLNMFTSTEKVLSQMTPILEYNLQLFHIFQKSKTRYNRKTSAVASYKQLSFLSFVQREHSNSNTSNFALTVATKSSIVYCATLRHFPKTTNPQKFENKIIYYNLLPSLALMQR